MSSSSSSYSYTQSFSSSSSSSTDPSGQTHTQRITQQTHSTPEDGTKIHTLAEETGKPRREEFTQIPAATGIGAGAGTGQQQGRIEDLDEKERRDREYEERIEEEYAKREGGA